MEVKVLEEAGYDQALRGMAYSYKDRSLESSLWWEGQREKGVRRAEALSNKDGGHNKFLESIQVWIDVEGSRAFWSEFDTYRVGTTKQSESTMHTLSKRAPTFEDFEVGTPHSIILAFMQCWVDYNRDVTALKQSLPEGFLQRRIVCTNYKVLRNIIAQRTGHRYKWWDVFINEVVSQLQHPTLVTTITRQPE
jgi:hypothetical protein